MIDNNTRVQFTISCYPAKGVAYDHPDHPRHAFSENWDDAFHPRFNFGRIRDSLGNLMAKGYTVHTTPNAIMIHNKSGEVEFKMEWVTG